MESDKEGVIQGCLLNLVLRQAHGCRLETILPVMGKSTGSKGGRGGTTLFRKELDMLGLRWL